MSAAFAAEGKAEELFFSLLIELQIDPEGIWVVSTHPRGEASDVAALVKTLRKGAGAFTHVKLDNGSALYTGSVSALAAWWMSFADAALEVRPFGEDALGAWWSCLSVEQRGSLPLPAMMTRTEVIARLCEGRPLGSSADITCELQTARADYIAHTLLLEEAAEARAKAGRQEQQLRKREKQRVKLSEAKEHGLIVAQVARVLVAGVLANGLQHVRIALQRNVAISPPAAGVVEPQTPPWPSALPPNPPTAFDVAAAAIAPVAGRSSSVKRGGSSRSPAPSSPASMSTRTGSNNGNRPRSATMDSEPASSGRTTTTRARANTAESINSNDSQSSSKQSITSAARKTPNGAAASALGTLPSSSSPAISASMVGSQPIASLRNDIEEMAASLDLVAARRQPWQLAVAERVKQMVYSIWPGAWCDVFGSIASGLAAPCSDVDMVVRGVPDADRVQLLASHLARQEWVQGLQAIERTLVPVVKFSTAAIPIAFGNRGNVINCDITFENQAHHGLNTCQLVRQLTARWPCLKPLVLVLKQFLVEKGLNDPYVGGLSSYALVIMLTAVIKRKYPSGYPYPGAADLGVLFVSFLEVYSSPAFLRDGVRLDEQYADQRFARNLHDPVFILDPLDPLNNVGRTCYGITQVVSAFAEALHAVRSIDRVDADSSVLGRVFSTGHHRDVVDLVTKVWCPPELPSPASGGAASPAASFQLPASKRVPPPYVKGLQPAPMFAALPWVSPVANAAAVEVWARDAKAVLEATARDADSGVVVCPVCRHVRGHAPECMLLALLRSFPRF